MDDLTNNPIVSSFVKEHDNSCNYRHFLTLSRLSKHIVSVIIFNPFVKNELQSEYRVLYT